LDRGIKSDKHNLRDVSTYLHVTFMFAVFICYGILIKR